MITVISCTMHIYKYVALNTLTGKTIISWLVSGCGMYSNNIFSTVIISAIK